MLKVVSEFKKFISRGNAFDMAVGVIIGASFGTIVSSLVDDIIMPPLGVLIGGVDFSDLKITLVDAVMEGPIVITPAVTINYGAFINNLISFFIIMIAIFIILKVVNTIFRENLISASSKPTKDQILLTEIRDLLKKKGK